MKRREFITLLGGAAVWPLAAHAQHGNQTPCIALWVGAPRTSASPATRNSIPLNAARAGWMEGRRPCHADEWDRYADRGNGSCSRRKPARRESGHFEKSATGQCRHGRSSSASLHQDDPWHVWLRRIIVAAAAEFYPSFRPPCGIRPAARSAFAGSCRMRIRGQNGEVN
jgi:hypothetical protein